jgi:hypothetical protein
MDFWVVGEEFTGAGREAGVPSDEDDAAADVIVKGNELEKVLGPTWI